MNRPGRYTGRNAGESLHLDGNLSRCWPPFRSRSRVVAGGAIRWRQRESPLMSLTSIVLGSFAGAGAVIAAVMYSWAGHDVIELAIYAAAIVVVMVVLAPRARLTFDPSTSEIVMQRGWLSLSPSRALPRDVELGVHAVEQKWRGRHGFTWTWRGFAVILWLPDDRRYVFTWARTRDEALAYAEALPPELKKLIPDGPVPWVYVTCGPWHLVG